MFSIIILLLWLQHIICSDVYFSKNCNEYKTSIVENLVIDKCIGSWYETHRYQVDSTNNACTTRLFSNFNETALEILHVHKNLYTKRSTVLEGVIKFENINEGKFVAAIPNYPKLQYHILDTDYSSYLIVWGCIDNGQKNSTQALWVLSRTPTLADVSESVVSHVLARNGLDATKLIKTIQDSEKCGNLREV